MNGAESLLRTAADAGVEICFSNPGTTEMPLVAAMDRVPGIRSVLGLFEGVCTGAADGYGRMAGKPALTLLHLGPGFANGIANLHNARRARSPIVNLVGDQATWHLAHDAPLTSDIASLARPVSGWVHQTLAASEAASDVSTAIARATGRPGSVSTLILPADATWEDAEGPVATPAASPLSRAPAERIEAAAEKLRAAGEAVFLLGGPALGAAGQRAAARIAAATGARVLVETFPARWERGANLPAFSRLPYFPQQAQEALAGTGPVVLVGARAPVSFFGYEGVPSELAEPHRTIELASPSEDCAQALEALAEILDAREGAAAAAPAAPAFPDSSLPLDPGSIGATLAACVPEDAVVMEEAATSGLPFYDASTGSLPHTVLTLTGGAIGQGLPCATGAALACPDRPVIAFQADGSGLYTAQALWTQAREGLPVVTLLCSNRAYRILQIEMARTTAPEAGPKARALMSLEEPSLDWVSLARGFGVPASRAETAGTMRTALEAALAAGGPHLIELSM